MDPTSDLIPNELQALKPEVQGLIDTFEKEGGKRRRRCVRHLMVVLREDSYRPEGTEFFRFGGLLIVSSYKKYIEAKTDDQLDVSTRLAFNLYYCDDMKPRRKNSPCLQRQLLN